MRMEQLDTANDLYINGANVRMGIDFLTLHDMAIDANNAKVPSFSIFKRYYGDEYYSHKMINDVFTLKSPYKDFGTTQRVIIVQRSLQYLVVQMRLLSHLYSSYYSCGKLLPYIL